MPAQLTYGTAGATGGGFAGYKGLQPLFREERGDIRPGYSWQRRSVKTLRDRNAWRSCWSFGCKTAGSGGGTDGDPPVTESGHGYEPFSCDGEGTQSMRFIRGYSRDSAGAILANAIVQAFVTATDAGQVPVTSGTDGFFAAPTETLPGVQHYLVAYKPGSPDVAGTTVNTLVSTNIDGS